MACMRHLQRLSISPSVSGTLRRHNFCPAKAPLLGSKKITTRTAASMAQRPGKTKKLLLVVGVALIKNIDGEARKVLLAQRPVGKSNAGLWEFPGGKIDPGETPEGASVRELKEELGISVQPEALQPLGFASHGYPNAHILMPLYACAAWEGEPTGAEGQAIVWADAKQLMEYSLTPPDIPLVPDVLRALGE
eukprot:gene15641-21750_t